jgi:hypothetical protein
MGHLVPAELHKLMMERLDDSSWQIVKVHASEEPISVLVNLA